jgi:ABC-2 type transport system permease protein
MAVSARRTVAERGGLVVAVCFYALVVLVLGSLWRAAAGANDGMVVGYSAAALSWYIAMSEAAVVSIDVRLIEDIGTDIAGGAVTVELLRPASVLGLRVAAQLGRTLPRLAACFVSGGALTWLVAGAPPDAGGLALAAAALVLAVALNLVAQHAFAAAAFWVHDARSTWFLYLKLTFILGGMLIPLEVLPGGLETTAKLLPFMAMAYVPARLASGHVEPQLLAVQLGWLVGLALVARAVFAAGERRLRSVGG